MGIKFILPMAFALTCISCTGKIDNSFKDENVISLTLFTISSPIELPNEYQRDDGSIARTNFKAPKRNLDAQDVLLEAYELSNCPPLGISNPAIMNGAQWGQVDYFDIYHTGDFPNMEEPFCRPAGGPTGVGYAFCAEKDDKAVAICIQQMTDNPALAKEIFESFKWTE